MKTLLSRASLLGSLLLLPGCASLAQDPQPYRTVYYSAEELDNLVAPVALYPDALLAQILVAATFPEQIAMASRHVRERGTRYIDEQGWDISVKAVAYYPPLLNMLARDEDWTIALGQAYASQSADVMDAVQRLREMAREQGNLVTTREHVVTEDRGRIIIVPANPQVIYVPTYDPAIVYVRPIFSFGFHTGYFSFGLGFPIGSWLGYDVDWWGHRVYYDGWYGDGWRYHARRYFGIIPVYHRPRYSVVNININIFSRRVNYINLDRRHRYVRREVVFERHDRGGRYADRDRNRWRDDDSRGPYVGSGDNDRDSDRIASRIAAFDEYRRDGGATLSSTRDAAPVTRSGFGATEKRKPNGPARAGTETRGGGGSEVRGSRPNVPVFTSQPRSAERKSNGNGGQQQELRGSRPNVPVFTSQPRATEGKSKGNGGSPQEYRSARPNAPVFTAPPRSVERGKATTGGGRPQSTGYRSARPNAPVFTTPPRSVERDKATTGGGRPQSAGYRTSAPRPNAPVYSTPQRSVQRKSGGGGGAGAQISRPMRTTPSVSRPSGGSGGGVRAQSSRPSVRSAPSMSRAPSGGGGGKVKASGGGKPSGGGKGRK